MRNILAVGLLAASVALVYGAQGLRDLGQPGWSCDPSVMGRSPSVPTNVNALRYADFDVIGALGDSLTAGNGAGARPGDPVAVILQYRGLTFAAGGQMTLDEHITIPNILKKFNPKLIGFSTGTGSENVWSIAKLNSAVPGAHSGDLVDQAHDLIKKMKDHPEINIKEHWKMVQIFIGGNDICAYCRRPDSESPNVFRDNIKAAVQVLKDNLPRTVVVLMGMLDLSMLRQIDHGVYFCDALHVFECSCEQNINMTSTEISSICHQYMKTEQELEDTGIFDTTDDFTLTIQPMWEGLSTPPLKPDGKPDLSFFAPDCFHFSQYGHAVVAKNLWNNMNQPVGMKSNMGNITDIGTNPLLCPDPTCPFLRTTKNSKDCSKYVN